MSLFFPEISLPKALIEKQSEISSLLVKRLRNHLRVKSVAAPAGVVKSSYRGIEGDFYASRQYVPGDDVRSFDWSAYARTGIPHVKIKLAEKQPVFWLAVDMSASMRFGRNQSKAKKAIDVAKAVAVLAKKTGGRLGAVLVGESVRVFKPSGKRTQIDQIVSAMSDQPSATDVFPKIVSSLTPSLKRWHEVILISDFVEPDFSMIERLSMMCQLRSIAILDEADIDLPQTMGILHLKCPETGKIVSSSASNITKLKQAVSQKRSEVASCLSKLGTYAEYSDSVETISELWRLS